MLTALSQSSMNGWLAVSAIAGMTLVIGVVTGSGVAATFAVAPLLPPIAEAVGIPSASAIIPTCYAAGIARAVSPVSAALIIAAAMSNVSVIDLVKRNIIPSIVAFLMSILTSMFLI